MKLKLLMLATVFMGLLNTALAGDIVVGTASSQGQGSVTVPLSLTGNTHAIGSVTITITYDGNLVDIAAQDLFLAGDSAAAGWQLHASSLPPSQAGEKGILLHLYQGQGSTVLSGEVIHLADIQVNVLNATASIPLTVSSFIVRDKFAVNLSAQYTSVNGRIN